MRINGHGHILPEPSQIPKFLKDKRLFWIDEDKKFMRQGEWSRPINGSGFFLKEKIEWMKQNNIDHAVMLCLSQLYCNGWGEKDCADAIRFQNDFNASIQRDYPQKFTCGFVVQPLYIDHALKEIDRCVNELGLKLLCLPTHFVNSKGEWLSIAEAEVDPIFELANKYKLAIQIHPYDGEKMIALKNSYWRFHLIWMMAQCADTLHLFTLRDLPNKYPNIVGGKAKKQRQRKTLGLDARKIRKIKDVSGETKALQAKEEERARWENERRSKLSTATVA